MPILISFNLNVLLLVWYQWQCNLICDRYLFTVFITYSFHYLHALSCTCPFSEHFTLRSHYTRFTVLLLLVTCHFLYMRILFHQHYPPNPLHALSFTRALSVPVEASLPTVTFRTSALQTICTSLTERRVVVESCTRQRTFGLELFDNLYSPYGHGSSKSK